MLKNLSKLLLNIGLEVLDEVEGGLVKTAIERVKEHFQTSGVLRDALRDAYEKGIESVRIALVGPRFYSSTVHKEFAEKFHKEVLSRVAMTQRVKDMEQEEFIAKAIEDLDKVKQSEVLRPERFGVDELMEALGVYMSVNSRQELEELERSADQEYIELVKRETSPPYALVEILRVRNVIFEAADMHFSMELARDEKLFRMYWRVSQENMSKLLELISIQMKQAKGEELAKLEQQYRMMSEIKDKLGGELKRVNQEIISHINQRMRENQERYGVVLGSLQELLDIARASQKDIRDIASEIREIKTMVVEIMREMKLGVKPSLTDTFTVTYAGREKTRRLVERFKKSRVEVREKPKLLLSVGRLLSTSVSLEGKDKATEELKSADGYILYAIDKSKDNIEKAKGWYTRYIAYMQKEEFEEAFVAYMRAV